MQEETLLKGKVLSKKKKISETLVATPKCGESEVQEYLSETTIGFYQPTNHAKMIWQGNKSLIVDKVNYKSLVGKRLYLVGGNDCYGVLRINRIREIKNKEFIELSDKHRITEKEQVEWWPTKEILYAYEFEFNKFDLLKRVSVPERAGTVLNDLQFLSEDIESMEKMSEGLEDSLVISNFISLLGSMKDGELRSAKINIGMSESSLDFKEKFEKRLSDIFSKTYEGDIEYIWDSTSCGVPLFNLVLEKQEGLCKKYHSLVKPFQLFDPMTPGKIFCNLEDTLDYMFKGE